MNKYGTTCMYIYKYRTCKFKTSRIRIVSSEPHEQLKKSTVSVAIYGTENL